MITVKGWGTLHTWDTRRRADPGPRPRNTGKLSEYDNDSLFHCRLAGFVNFSGPTCLGASPNDMKEWTSRRVA